MPRFHNREEYNRLRKDLRRVLTKAEVVLWYYLKGRQFHGYKFRRQHGIGRYVVDFYCPALKMAIELDGSQHYEREAKEYDREREAFLNGLGIQVVRFPNNVVIRDVRSVLAALGEIVEERGRVAGPPPPPTSAAGLSSS